jgi:hypothetical protein
VTRPRRRRGRARGRRPRRVGDVAVDPGDPLVGALTEQLDRAVGVTAADGLGEVVDRPAVAPAAVEDDDAVGDGGAGGQIGGRRRGGR